MHQTVGNVYQLHGAAPYQGRRSRQSPIPPAPPPRWLALCLIVCVILVFSCACSDASPACDVLPGASPADCQAVRALAQAGDLPPAAGNIWADDPNTALFGFHMFYDARFSAGAAVRCATCHAPELHFTDGKPLAQGLSTASRNAPTLLNAAWNHWQFWDGRADSVWSQPLFAMENPNEMGGTRLGVAHTVASAFADEYQPIFGALPDLNDTRRFPPSGAPGDPNFDRMSAADQDAINRVAANVGKALEAYLRRVAAGPSPFDAYLHGQSDAISAHAVNGLRVFVRAGCIGCHSGGNLTDDGFHNLGVPGWPGANTDAGRSAGMLILAANPFNSHGPYYDGDALRSDDSAASSATFAGAFKTPSLRNLAISAPYGHNGIFATLDDVVDFHLQGGRTPDVGERDALLQRVQLTPNDRSDLLTWLQTMSGTYRGQYGVPPYWWDWPDR